MSHCHMVTWKYATKESKIKLVLIAVIHFLCSFIDSSASSVWSSLDLATNFIHTIHHIKLALIAVNAFVWLKRGLYQITTRMNVIPSGAVPIKPHSKGVVPVRPRTEMRIFCFVKCDPMKPQLNWILEIIEIPFDFHKFNKTVVGRGSFKPQPN